MAAWFSRRWVMPSTLPLPRLRTHWRLPSPPSALHEEPWDPAIGHVRVRMALHTGAAEQRDGDYFGPPLNRVARLLAAGHGGQTLLSLPTRALAGDQLPAGVELRDLGEHRLKDLQQPEHIFQVVAPDLLADFPPLKTLDLRPNNLPRSARR